MPLAATFAPSRPAATPADGTFSQRFRATCARQGAMTAIVDGDRRLTFAEWARLSEALAGGLAQSGVRRGDAVAFQLPNWWETCVLFAAIARLGAIANPLLPIWRERELVFMLRQSGARHLFVPRTHRSTDYAALAAHSRELGAPVEHVFHLRDGDDFERLCAAGDAPDAVSQSPEDLLLLMYTSGTTADPKGVLHTHATLIAEVDSLCQVHRLDVHDAILMPSPLTHISGLLHAILCPAILGTRAVLMDRWQPSRARNLIAGERVTYMVGAPVFLQDLLAGDADSGWAASLRLFSCGGAVVSADLMRRAAAALGCVAKRVYGSTEFPTITTTAAGDAQDRASETEGAAIPPNQLRIVDGAGHPLPPGLAGEIQARGPECFVGYVDRQMNRDAFTGDGWYRTGDIGTVDDAGYLTITGRIKEIVIRKGEKISIREIEDLLQAHPAVHGVCVVGVADEEVGERLCVALVVAEGARLTASEVTDYLRGKGLATQKLPERIAFAPSLPRTESGKIQRAAVVSLFDQREGAGGR